MLGRSELSGWESVKAYGLRRVSWESRLSGYRERQGEQGAGHPMRPAAMMLRSTSLCRTRLWRYGPVFMPQCSFRVLFREVLHGKRPDRGDDGHTQKHA